MKTLISHSTDPYFNLAWEEYIFKHIECDEDILLLWRNAPSVIVGRNQIIYGEVEVAYCKTHNIPIIRRISGGGTVYHDLGNLNYSVITKQYKDVISNYAYFTKPILTFLNNLGIHATFSGKSDLKIGNQKISGNAQIYHQNRMLHHGTLLLESDLNRLNQVIKLETKDIISIGVPSNRSMVTNVYDHLKTKMSFHDFLYNLQAHWVYPKTIQESSLEISVLDFQAIEQLKQSKYHSWVWNYGESPAFEIHKEIGTNQIQVKVTEGFIEKCMYTNEVKSQIITALKGIPFDVEAYQTAIAQFDNEHKKLLESFKVILFK